VDYFNTFKAKDLRYIHRVQPTRGNFSQFIYFCKTLLYMFQTAFSSIVRSSKLHIQREVFVRPIMLPAASLARLCVQFWAPDDGRKNRLKHVERLTEINKLWNVASCWLYAANILAMLGHMNVRSVEHTGLRRNEKDIKLYLLIYSMEQSPSWEDNRFSASQ